MTQTPYSARFLIRTCIFLNNMVKDKTGGERQSRLRLARSKWLKEHGFNSAEGLLGALMRGEVVLQVASVPTKRAADICPRCEGVVQYVDYIGKRVCSLCDGTGKCR